MRTSEERKEVADRPHAILAWQLIRAYLKRRGYRLESIHTLPARFEKELMTAANLSASLKLAVIESRSNLRQKIHT